MGRSMGRVTGRSEKIRSRRKRQKKKERKGKRREEKIKLETRIMKQRENEDVDENK